MIYTKMTKAALNLCFEAHKNQRDKSGMPYVFHPFHLAEQMKDEKTTIVALLHDVVEDTDVTLDDMRNMGFDNEVVAAIELMTHGPNVPYMEYVSRIKKNPIVLCVFCVGCKNDVNEKSESDSISEAASAEKSDDEPEKVKYIYQTKYVDFAFVSDQQKSEWKSALVSLLNNEKTPVYESAVSIGNY